MAPSLLETPVPGPIVPLARWPAPRSRWRERFVDVAPGDGRNVRV